MSSLPDIRNRAQLLRPVQGNGEGPPKDIGQLPRHSWVQPVTPRGLTYTALLPTSLPLPQQQALLDGQTACKTLPSAQLGQALPVINPSARIHRHQGLGSAAACCMLASNSPWRSPNSLSAPHTPCREMASPLGAHPNYRPPKGPGSPPPLPAAPTPPRPLATLTGSPETHLPFRGAPQTITRSLSLEKTLNGIESTTDPAFAKSTTKPDPQEPRLRGFSIPPGMVTPPLPWADGSSAR